MVIIFSHLYKYRKGEICHSGRKIMKFRSIGRRARMRLYMETKCIGPPFAFAQGNFRFARDVWQQEGGSPIKKAPNKEDT